MQDLEELSDLKVTVPLKKRCPRALRSIFKRCLPWFLVYFIMLFMVTHALSEVPEVPIMPEVHSWVVEFLLTLFFISKIVLVLKVLYEVMFYMSYQYHIEEGHIVITTGVFLKKRGSFPINSLSDISLERGVLELIFGLYNLNIATSSNEYTDALSPVRGFLSVTDLTTKVAVRLQDFLNREVVRVTPSLKGRVNASRQRGEPVSIKRFLR